MLLGIILTHANIVITPFNRNKNDLFLSYLKAEMLYFFEANSGFSLYLLRENTQQDAATTRARGVSQS